MKQYVNYRKYQIKLTLSPPNRGRFQYILRFSGIFQLLTNVGEKTMTILDSSLMKGNIWVTKKL